MMEMYGFTQRLVYYECMKWKEEEIRYEIEVEQEKAGKKKDTRKKSIHP